MESIIWFYLSILLIGYSLGVTAISRRNESSNLVVTQDGVQGSRGGIGIAAIFMIVLLIIFLIPLLSNTGN